MLPALYPSTSSLLSSVGRIALPVVTSKRALGAVTPPLLGSKSGTSSGCTTLKTFPSSSCATSRVVLSRGTLGSFTSCTGRIFLSRRGKPRRALGACEGFLGFAGRSNPKGVAGASGFPVGASLSFGLSGVGTPAGVGFIHPMSALKVSKSGSS